MTAFWNPVFEWDNDSWRDQAACRHTGANLFFPAGSTGSAIDQIDAAKVVCRSCPVQGCLSPVRVRDQPGSGVWGGKDEDERRKLRKTWRAGRQRPTTSAAR